MFKLYAVPSHECTNIESTCNNLYSLDTQMIPTNKTTSLHIEHYRFVVHDRQGKVRLAFGHKQ